MKIENVPAIIAGILESGKCCSMEIRMLQRMVYVDGAMSRDAAGWLIAVRAATGIDNADFASLFIEVLCDFIVYREGPSGRVTDEQAAWLLEALAMRRDGVCGLECDLVEAIIAEATQCSPTLVQFLRRHRATSEAQSSVIDATDRFALAMA